jgi:hypothetical protein
MPPVLVIASVFQGFSAEIMENVSKHSLHRLESLAATATVTNAKLVTLASTVTVSLSLLLLSAATVSTNAPVEARNATANQQMVKVFVADLSTTTIHALKRELTFTPA